jgi:thiol-disulfide isomerase/thioredoxin
VTNRLFLAVAAASIAATAAPAGQFNSALSIGDEAPAWVDLPGTDGKKHSLADLREKDVVVVVFTCNSCPAAEAYEDRIIALAKKHCGSADRVALVAINVNTIPDDRLDKMTERAKEKISRSRISTTKPRKLASSTGPATRPSSSSSTRTAKWCTWARSTTTWRRKRPK